MTIAGHKDVAFLPWICWLCNVPVQGLLSEVVDQTTHFETVLKMRKRCGAASADSRWIKVESTIIDKESVSSSNVSIGALQNVQASRTYSARGSRDLEFVLADRLRNVARRVCFRRVGGSGGIVAVIGGCRLLLVDVAVS